VKWLELLFHKIGIVSLLRFFSCVPQSPDKWWVSTLIPEVPSLILILAVCQFRFSEFFCHGEIRYRSSLRASNLATSSFHLFDYVFQMNCQRYVHSDKGQKFWNLALLWLKWVIPVSCFVIDGHVIWCHSTYEVDNAKWVNIFPSFIGHWARFPLSISISPASCHSTNCSILINHPVIDTVESRYWQRRYITNLPS
jgi:hypothetical protein